MILKPRLKILGFYPSLDRPRDGSARFATITICIQRYLPKYLYFILDF